VERLALGHLLRRAAYEVDEAADADSALLHLKHRQVDLLILDLQMPGRDGFDVLKYLQEHRPGLPVILMSGMPLDQIQYKMHSLRRPELPPFLIKPVDVEQVLELVELQLSEQLQRENLSETPWADRA
jgi:DNA-binding NtrC family response regulator